MLRRYGRAAPLALVLLVSCSSFGAPAGATDQGRDVNVLWRVFVVAGICVAGIVYGLIVWSLVRYRRRRRDDPDALPRQFRQHVPLEVAYTAIPIVIVIFLFAATAVTNQRVTATADRPAATIHVQGFTWGWRFAYEGSGVRVVSAPDRPPEMVIPVGEPVRIVLTSDDVIHSFFVPDFLFKRDAIPGHPTQFDLTAREEGIFAGRCAEFCGLNHAFMGFTVRVVAPDDYRRWLTERQGAAA
jgi:cytochrome c oxidase subunit 2